MGAKNKDPLLEVIKSGLVNDYQCHTIILYGSRAREDATAASDYDIIALRDKGDFERDCRLFNGFYLDVFIYSEDVALNPDPSMIRVKDGVVLLQKDQIGDELLSKVKAIFDAGPSPTPAWEKHEINAWALKMLDRAALEDIEGNFRRHWLLYHLLECYFKLRDSWYLGPKESFRWLRDNDLGTYTAFDVALKPNAGLDAISRLIELVRK
jgi:predicted nucleotidyltransferase